MRNIAVIDGHPDADRSHLNHALADRYAASARAAGHSVRRINVAELDIPVLRVPADFVSAPAPAQIVQAQHDITWADHLVFFFPLWHGYMPAALKTFIEQTFRPGYALDYSASGFPKRLFDPKSARVVVTMGMPAFFYRAYFRAHGVKAFERSVLGFAGIAPVYTTLLGGAGDGIEAKARRWLALMDILAKRDGRSAPFGQRAAFVRGFVRTVTLLAASAAVSIACSRYAAYRRG